MADIPIVDGADFGLSKSDTEDYWKKKAAKLSGGASVSAPPPRSAWQVFTDAVHDAMSEVGNGLNATFIRGNQAERENDLIREDVQSHGGTPKDAEAIIRQNQQQRADAINEQRAQRAILMQDEQRHRSGLGKVVAKTADIAGSVVGDVNPTYAIPGIGETALGRMATMGAVAGADNLASQGDEYRRDIRQDIDPTEVLTSAVGGAGLQGAGEAVGKVASRLMQSVNTRAILKGLIDRGLTPEQAQGVTAGIVAESRANASAVNKDSGAMGYGQWLGSRKAELIRRYGPDPTHDEQLDFLVHELNGGDSGGPKVLANNDRHAVLESYIKDFMRPAKGKETQRDLSRGAEALGGEAPAAPDGLPGNGSVRPMDPEEIARVMNDPEAAGMDPWDEPAEAPRKTIQDLTDDEENRLSQIDDEMALTPEDRHFLRQDREGREDIVRSKAYDEAHQEWVDKNFDEGTVVRGFGHNIDEHGNYKDPQIVRALEDQDSELARARRAKDYAAASDMIDDLHYKVSNLLDAVYHDEGRGLPSDAAERTRSSVNVELHNYEPGTPEHSKLLEIDDMLKEAIARSGGKPRIYEPEASEKFLSGEPKVSVANDTNFEPRVPGKTLHEHTDPEFNALSPEDRKALISEANDKLFYPERKPSVGDVPEYPGEYNPVSSSRLPSSSKLYKPLDEIKGGSHDEGDVSDELPSLKKQKKLVIDKLADALEQGKPLRREAEDAISKERSRRLAAAMKVRQTKGGEAGFYSELGAMKGEMGRPKIESIRSWFSQPEIDQLFDIVKTSPNLQGYDSINAQAALKKLLGHDHGEIPTGREIELLARAMPAKASLWKQMLEDEGGALNLDALPEGAIKRAIVNVAGLPRTLKASFDFSAPFRQGMFLVGRKEFWKAMPDMFKSFFSEGHFNKLQQEIFDRPTYPLMNRAGLQTTKNNAGLLDREEAFISQFAEKIPGVRHSERAYIAFLNRVRADVFDDFVRKGEELGIDFIHDPHYLKSAASFINSATGRGNLSAVARDARLLSNVLFSPKLMKSRIDMLNPAFYAGLHPKVREEAAKSGLIYAGTVMSMLGLAAAAGAKVEMDARSSDFAKIKIGNTRMDVTGGFQPYVRFYSQFLMGQQKGINDEVVRNVGSTFKFIRDRYPGVDQPAFKPTTRKDLIYKFFENKESPNANEVTRLLQESDAVGNPLGHDANLLTDTYGKATGQKVPAAVNEVTNMFIPLIVNDTYQAAQDLGAKGLITAVPNAFGVGIQTYTPKKKSGASVNLSDFGGAGTVSLKDFK